MNVCIFLTLRKNNFLGILTKKHHFPRFENYPLAMEQISRCISCIHIGWNGTHIRSVYMVHCQGLGLNKVGNKISAEEDALIAGLIKGNQRLISP